MATTFTEMIHSPSPVTSLAGTVAPLMVMLLAPAAAVTVGLPQLVLTTPGVAAITMPVGNVSVQPAAVNPNALGLEIEMLEKELAEVRALIKELEEILNSKTKLMDVIKKNLLDIKRRYKDPRRTIIMNEETPVEVKQEDFKVIEVFKDLKMIK